MDTYGTFNATMMDCNAEQISKALWTPRTFLALHSKLLVVSFSFCIQDPHQLQLPRPSLIRFVDDIFRLRDGHLDVGSGVGLN